MSERSLLTREEMQRVLENISKNESEINLLLHALNCDTVEEDLLRKYDPEREYGIINRTLWRVANRFKNQLSIQERKILFGEN